MDKNTDLSREFYNLEHTTCLHKQLLHLAEKGSPSTMSLHTFQGEEAVGKCFEMNQEDDSMATVVMKGLLVVLHREVVVVIIVLDVWMAWRWRRLHGFA